MRSAIRRPSSRNTSPISIRRWSAPGTAAETAAIAKSYGVGYVRQATRSDGGYAVDHSSVTYVIGPDGKLVDMLPLGVTTDKVVATVRKLL
ncbi:MAG: SCO family protein [Sulfuritalea sp.]|nr:SCO family protein [Sulfuritalea sp.]